MRIISSQLRRWYGLTLFVKILLSLISVLVPIYSGQFLNQVINGSHQLFGQALWFFLFLSISEILVSTLGTYLDRDLVKRAKNEFRENILRRLFLSPTYQEEQLSAATTDLNVNSQALADDYVKGEVDIVNCSVLIAATAIGLFTINLALSVVILVVSVLIILFPKALAKRSQTNRAAQAGAQDRLNKSVGSFMRGIETLNSFGAQQYYHELTLKHNWGLYRTEGKANIYVTETYGVNSFLQVMKTFLVIALGAGLISKGSLEVGGLFAAIQLAANLGAPMEVLAMLLYYRREALPLAERLNAYNATPSEQNEVRADPVTRIAFINFSQKTDDKYVLTNINLRFFAGKKYVLVGKSGAGKSTVLRSIARVLVGVPSGHLLINGDSQSAFSRIKLVTQTPAVFNANLIDNLFMGKALNQTQLQTILDLLELNELATRVGLRNALNETDLSGGEKQRIALGRALLAKPDVLLLDEFNSALDAHLSKKLETYVLELPCMIVSVMHHLDSDLIARYDEVITIANGKVKNIKVQK